jgi:hypothetical protein
MSNDVPVVDAPVDEQLDPGLAGKLMVGVAVVAAGMVAQQGLRLGWRLATGHDAPHANDDQIPLAQVIVYAAASAAAVAALRVWAQRRAMRMMTTHSATAG